MQNLLLYISIQYYRIRAFITGSFLKKKKSAEGVLFLSTFFPENSGYHWRSYKWMDIISKDGKKSEVFHAINESDFYELIEHNHPKFLRLYLKNRFRQVLRSRSFETVIVRRELLLFNDYGNLFLEKLLLKFHPDAILDFDDDISAAKKEPREITSLFGKLLAENGNKFNDSLKLYKRFIVVSSYMKDKLLSESPQTKEEDICVIPTCVDYDQYPTKVYNSTGPKVIGWIGGDHNYPLLDSLLPTLNKLSETNEFTLLVIGRKTYKREVNFPIQFVKWDLISEVENIKRMDIGLMPLSDDIADKGKSGFKLIQYMGLGIVSVASSVTINREIINDGVNGFLVNRHEDWETILSEVINKKKELFEQIGTEARKTVESEYSFSANKEKYITFILKS